VLHLDEFSTYPGLFYLSWKSCGQVQVKFCTTLELSYALPALFFNRGIAGNGNPCPEPCARGSEPILCLHFRTRAVEFGSRNSRRSNTHTRTQFVEPRDHNRSSHRSIFSLELQQRGCQLRMNSERIPFPTSLDRKRARVCTATRPWSHVNLVYWR